jgi:putative phosphoribosyl transferase
MVVPLFLDRRDAGRRIASRVIEQVRPGPADDVIVLGLPRGGVIIAAQIAAALRLPAGGLDVLIVRKIGAPLQPELALGAVADDHGRPAAIYSPDLVQMLSVDEEFLQHETQREYAEVLRRQDLYRRGREAPRLTGRTVILADDGIATGATAKAALRVLRAQKPARIILAVPVASHEALDELTTLADQVVCLSSPVRFESVGRFYREFEQVSDAEVIDELTRFACVVK